MNGRAWVLLCGACLAACVSPEITRDPLSGAGIDVRACPPGSAGSEWKEGEVQYLGCATPEGDLHGPLMSYHQNAVRRSFWELNHNVRDGRYVQWYASGWKLVEGRFVVDRAEGVWIWWWENGQRRIEATFHSGHLNGSFTAWHENGVRSALGEMRADVRNGEWQFWDEKGRPIAIPIGTPPWEIASVFGASLPLGSPED